VDRFALERARAGDQDAFAALTDPHRRELHLHCYRMLGSVTDADDLLQDTLTSAWRGLAGFAGRSSLRTWLYRIATHRCLNAIRDAKRRPLPTPVPPFEPPAPSHRGDVTWLQPYPTPGSRSYRDRRSATRRAKTSSWHSSPPCNGSHLARPPPSFSATCSISIPPRSPACWM